MTERPRIIEVTRKPLKCPVCREKPVDIIYGTGNMTEAEFLYEYRREGIMGGDNIPRRPPIWACPCGCKRFRKVNPDGTDAPVKVKLMKNIRRAPLTKITWETGEVTKTRESVRAAKYYLVEFETELGETDTLCVCSLDEDGARNMAENVISYGGIGLKGRQIKSMRITEDNR
jgi:hypothetical protein